MEDIPAMSVKDFRANLGRRIDEAYFRHEPTKISKNGQTRAVLVNPDWWARAVELMTANGEPEN